MSNHLNITLKHLNANDWQLYKTLRLQSLQQFPHYFSPSQDEIQFSPQDWQARLSNRHTANFALFNQKQAIGLTGIIKENLNPHSSTGILVASYIDINYQGQGLSNFFYQARIDWAKEQGLVELKIEHHQNNLACKHAHQKFGFQLLKTTHYIDSCGQEQTSEIYYLRLDQK
ncbi:GNAT family N-acetyltransferase [bacterium]|nr:GNAT family N-acetyltransferase [bacterium]